ncbi:MAG: phenylalanine--tRNA ligase subunit beta [Bacteroidia bacterium]
MYILYSWLKEFLPQLEEPYALAEKLTLSGLEVENLIRLSPPEGIYVVEVQTLYPHPTRPNLHVAQITNGQTTHTVISGAPNLMPHHRYVWASPGTNLPTGMVTPRTFDTLSSEGMLCSAEEIGFFPEKDKLLELPPDTPLGRFSWEEDYLLEISVTPNRGDALSHWGIAREYAAITGSPLKDISFTLPAPTLEKNPIHIEVPHPESVPRYGTVYLANLKFGPSPLWMRRRLALTGFKPQFLPVDVTNYLLIGWGQPLHAFDADTLTGQKISIGPLKEATTFTGLNGQTYALQKGDIVIQDEEKVSCLGGILGSAASAVKTHTKAILLESAYFNPTSIHKTQRRLGIQTESAYRFARGTDPERVPWAAQFATYLLLTYGQGDYAPFTEVASPSHYAPRKIFFSWQKAEHAWGIQVSPEKLAGLLKKLDIQVNAQDSPTWELHVPRYRLDITRPVDILEELLRLVGMNTIPDSRAHLPPAAPDRPLPTPKKALSEYLTGLGMYEIRTNSLCPSRFIPEKDGAQAIRLYNPLHEDMAYLRTHMAPSGLEVIAYNKARGQNTCWLYEWGKLYRQVEGAFVEKEVLGLWAWGTPPHGPYDKDPHPFFTFRAMVESLFMRAHVPFRSEALQAETPFAYGVKWYESSTLLGMGGSLLPSFLHTFDLVPEVFYAELRADFWQFAQPLRYEEVPRYALITKDLSFYVPPTLEFSRLHKALHEALAPYLQKIHLFDVFEKENKKSYAIRLYLQPKEKTFTETEIAMLLHRAEETLAELGAPLRKA